MVKARQEVQFAEVTLVMSTGMNSQAVITIRIGGIAVVETVLKITPNQRTGILQKMACALT